MLPCSPFSGEEIEAQRRDLLPASLTHKSTNSANLGGHKVKLLNTVRTGAWDEHLLLEVTREWLYLLETEPS